MISIIPSDATHGGHTFSAGNGSDDLLGSFVAWRGEGFSIGSPPGKVLVDLPFRLAVRLLLFEVLAHRHEGSGASYNFVSCRQ